MEHVRTSLNWLHTWAGVVLGALLFAIFWTGTIIVFDRELDRWMMPETRLSYADEPVSIDWLKEEGQKFAPRPWAIVMPNPRDPFVWVGVRSQTGFTRKLYDPISHRELPQLDTWAATRFFFPFHYMLHLKAWNIGMWLVGLAGMGMLALCVSGAIIHRKIFTDFFTLRRPRQPQRLILDLHNTAGTLGLVFFIVMSWSGLTIVAANYLPAALWVSFKGDRWGHITEAYDIYNRPALGKPGQPLGSLDDMIASARRDWDGLGPTIVRVFHGGDANAFVKVRPSLQAEVNMRTDPIYFDAATGKVLHRTKIPAITDVQQFLTGLHFIQFRHWTLRWIYLALGLLGCLLIATGFMFWLESRRKAHAAAGLPGVRIVEGIAVGSTVGMIAATLAFMIANRLLPAGASFLGGQRYELEIWAFFAVWAMACVHGWVRPRRAWAEQCWIAAAGAVVAVALNTITTGDHLARTIVDGKWAVAGVDLMLLCGASAAAVTAWRLDRRRLAARQSFTNEVLS
ncbi:MAG TPA: PepSY-associated TM helix domain-containing protein [Reyranella sp.]|nr:PepSY-associated TM helix domain-containing protein [Reyranella sp.]